MSGEVVLSIEALSVWYGNIQALRGISFDVRQGEMVALIGANGAGKSSTLRAISGMVPYEGSIAYKGRSLRGIPSHRIAALGIAHVPEGRGIFGNLKVSENLKLATWHRKDKDGIAKDYRRIFALFPVLYERREQSGGTLSGGEQQMLAVARALMSRGSLMLLDEPSMGLAPMLVQEIFSVLKEINRTGSTILLVEQNAHISLRNASFGHVLETGAVVLSGPGESLLNDPHVRAAYLGAPAGPAT
jgi:branched-chain amino acid transport system ATP-binding protein